MTFQNKKNPRCRAWWYGYFQAIAYLRKNGAEVAAYDAELKPGACRKSVRCLTGWCFTRVV